MPNPLIVGALLLVAALLGVAADGIDKEKCEIDVAARLKTHAIWINGRCMVEGYVAYKP